MDVLKMLTRSTNLKKKSASQTIQRRELPSNGAPSHPQALAESSSVDAAVSKRGTKRKRGGVATSQDISDVPDFFGEARVVDDEQEKDEMVDNTAGTTQSIVESRISGSGIMDLDERRSLLRKHKLKVHTMRAVAHTKSSKVKKSKKSKKEARQGAVSLEAVYPQPIQSFSDLRETRLSKRLLKNLEDQGYTMPTEIQMAALSLFLHEGNGLPRVNAETSPHIDLITVAPTGSGKTLAYLIPIMNDLLAERASSGRERNSAEKDTDRHVRAIVLAPTHELADQIVNEARKLAEGTGLKATSMQKGARLYQTPKDIGSEMLIKADIVVSTPLLLAHSLDSDADEQERTLSRVTHVVLDEADALLDQNFREQTMKVWDKCTQPSLKVSLWSATMGSSIETFTTDRVFSRLADAEKSARKNHHLVRIIAGLKDSAIPNVRHHLTYAATEQGKLLAMRQLLHPSANSTSDIHLRPPFLVFTQTIERAVALHSELLYDIPAEAGGATRIAVLHSDLSLSARSDIMARFRKGEIWIMITTDLLARGVDFRGVNGVVNYDIPKSSADYVHRAGRTGRAGREGGLCVTLYAREDIKYVKNVANVIAAAEKLKGKKLGDDGTAMPKWLLDALPDLSKETKKELKRKGVAARRSDKGGKSNGKGTMRISTKSGYERKLENRRRAARNPQKAAVTENMDADDIQHQDNEDADVFGGFDD